jgi:cephalosporin hydroxylase
METQDFNYCRVLAQMLAERRIVGRSGKVFDGLGAISTVNNLSMLRRLCLELKPKQTLEVGFCYAGSGLVFTSSHRDLGRSANRQHIALDPFQSSFWDDSGRLAVERAGLSGYLDCRDVFSAFELPKLIQEGFKADLVYVDGSHLFEDVFVDFYYVSRLLADGGVVLFDDSADAHVAKVLKFIRANMSVGFPEFDLAPFRTDQGRSVRYRASKFLRRAQLTAFQKTGVAERAWDARFGNF